MSQEAKTQACPECGGLMRYEEHNDALEHAGRKRTIKTLGWWCTKCGEAILTGDALVKHERTFLLLKASADGVLGPESAPLAAESAPGTKFDAFMREIEDEARAEGPEAVKELDALRAHYRAKRRG